MILPTVHLQRAWDSLPKSHRTLLVDRGLSVQLAPYKVIKAWGDYRIDFQSIRIAKHLRGYGQAMFLFHEIGHAMDNALQGGLGWWSNSPDFYKAFHEDLIHEKRPKSYDDTHRWNYKSINRSEVFADVYHALYGYGEIRRQYKPSTMLRSFPRCAEFMKDVIDYTVG